MAFAEDLSQFFSADDFAVEATIHSAPARTIKAIFETPSQSVEIFDTNLETDAPRLHCRTIDLVGVRREMQVSVNSVNYKIARISDDGTGASFVYLK